MRKHARITAQDLEDLQELVQDSESETSEPIVHVRKHKRGHGVRDLFRQFAHNTALYAGSPWAFLIAAALVVLWAVSGPLFHYSDTWQLTINTGTTIVTFLIVFLIQNTQNRDAIAMQLKLDELIRAVKGARNQLIDLEELSDEELEELHREFNRIHEFCQTRQQKRAGAKSEQDRHEPHDKK
jgi:low affinity Fe/Cu permease